MIPKSDMVPEGARRVLTGLRRSGHEAYLVGGCVRDVLIGRPLNDWDITTNATPEQVTDCFERVIPTGIEHGTVTVLIDREPYEVTTYRIDGSYSDGRRPDGVSFTRNIHEDLARRDFTMNAMAWCPATGVVVDPFGGRTDLDARLIRAVGDAHTRLSEDGLRAMRAIRFAAVLDFTIEDRLEHALTQTLPVFAKVSVERTAVELRKTLMSDRAEWGLQTLRKTGLLAAFLPDVSAMSETLFQRVCGGMSRSHSDFETRLALMLTPLGEAAGSAVNSLRYSKKVRESVTRLVSHRSSILPHPDDALGHFALARTVGRDELTRFAHYRAAWGDAEDDWRRFLDTCEDLSLAEVPLEPRELAIDGRAVIQALGIKPSRRVGVLLERLLQKVWEAPGRNELNYLLSILPNVAEELGDDP
jgi:tRNA nucleotidyltransferase (CCA-adding enzyme)